MKNMKGIPGAGGNAIGRVKILSKKKLIISEEITKDSAKEIDKLKQARADYLVDIQKLIAYTKDAHSEEEAAIFEAYAEIAKDDYFFSNVENKIVKTSVNADKALHDAMTETCQIFDTMEDEYMKERATDIKNVCVEIILYMQGHKPESICKEEKPYILVASDLTPADTVKLDKNILQGFITEKGGRTSHTVILAKTLGIPAIIGAKGILNEITDGELVIMDANSGEIIIQPTQQVMDENVKLFATENKRQEAYQKVAEKNAITLDGQKIEICVNSGDSKSLSNYDENICDGIGLFRTEFIYIESKKAPTEEEQFLIYKKIAKKVGMKKAIIRTLDIGGDKQVDYLHIPKEENPFLGYRAIRLCLDQTDIFKTQLRAILRASVYGNLKIMFPMIDTVEEFRSAKEQVKMAMESLEVEGISYNKEIAIGMMIETPSAAIASDILAKEADFFSIGTNDLIQYTTATDRMNEKVQYLYSNYNISVLRLIKIVAENAKANGINVGICGELASDELLTSYFVGIGIDELSIAAGQIGKIKSHILSQEKEKLKVLVSHILQATTQEEILEILKRQLKAEEK